MNEYDIYTQLSSLYFDVQNTDSKTNINVLFEYLKKFPNVAPFNLALVSAQRPGAAFFLSKAKWRELKREIKPDARPIIILRPFGPIEFVYDVSDTSGEPLPNEIENPYKIDSKFDKHKFLKFTRQLPNAGVKYVSASFGSQQAGSIAKLPKSEIISISASIKIKVYYQINCNENLSEAEKFATIAHELGHLFCGHLGTFDLNECPWSNRTNLNKNQNEFEAESVCWLVCERCKIHNPSAEYLREYLEHGKSIPQIDIGAILRAVTYIESMLNGYFKPLKSLLVKGNIKQKKLRHNPIPSPLNYKNEPDLFSDYDFSNN